MGGVAFRHLERETKGQRRMNDCEVQSSKGPLMAPSRRGQLTFKLGGRVVRGIAIRVFTLCRAGEIQAGEDWALAMAKRILPAMEGGRDGRNRGRNGGGRGAGGLGVDRATEQLNGDGGRIQGRNGLAWRTLQRKSAP